MVYACIYVYRHMSYVCIYIYGYICIYAFFSSLGSISYCRSSMPSSHVSETFLIVVCSCPGRTVDTSDWIPCTLGMLLRQPTGPQMYTDKKVYEHSPRQPLLTTWTLVKLPAGIPETNHQKCSPKPIR